MLPLKTDLSLDFEDPKDVRVHIAQTGTVVEVGSEVKNVKVGHRVAIEPGPSLVAIADTAGTANTTSAQTPYSQQHPPWDGTLAKYIHRCQRLRLPDPRPHEHGRRRARSSRSLLPSQIAKVADLKANQTVLSLRLRPYRRALPSNGVFMSPKADPGADPVEHSEKVAALIKEQFDLGEGPEVVLECTGAEPCIQAGIFATKKGGTYVQAGMGKENVVFPITTACIRALIIKGSIRYTTGVYPAAGRPGCLWKSGREAVDYESVQVRRGRTGV
ncbi:hypothetical protein L1887_59116 [Cichorium endivia]|nr:hypothetical protein L1887_59116 [Cichorium endivia]